MIPRRAFILTASSFFVNKPRTLTDICADLSDERTQKDALRLAAALEKEIRYFTTIDGKPTTAARGFARKLATIHEKVTSLLVELAEL